METRCAHTREAFDGLGPGFAYLAPEERQVLRRRLSSNGQPELSRAEVAGVCGITRARERLIEARARAKLRHPAYAGQLETLNGSPRRPS